MKLFPKTAEDFGIAYTGRKLEEYNKKLLDSFENDKNNTSKGQVKYYFIEIICLAINLFIAFDKDKKYYHPVITAITAGLSLITAGVFIYSLFVKDDALRRRIRMISAIAQSLLLPSVSFAAIGMQTLADFLLVIADLIIGYFAGMMSWSKITMKAYHSTHTGSEGSSGAFNLIGPIVSVAMVPVIRFLVGLLGENVKYSIGRILLILISGLLGWLFGVLTEGVLYYRFLKKQKGSDIYKEDK